MAAGCRQRQDYGKGINLTNTLSMPTTSSSRMKISSMQHQGGKHYLYPQASSSHADTDGMDGSSRICLKVDKIDTNNGKHQGDSDNDGQDGDRYLPCRQTSRRERISSKYRQK